MAAKTVKVVFATERIARAQSAKLHRGLTAVAAEYANLVKTLMRDSPATGRVYRRGSVTHRASAPGEPPAPDTGALMNSVQFRVVERGGVVSAEVGSRLRYALFLEYGAARGVKHARGRNAGRIRAVQWVLHPRPSWGPALSSLRPRLPAILAAAMRRPGA